MRVPNTPFSTRLSGSAKETELRLRSIFQWGKKRPSVMLILLAAMVILLCFELVSCDNTEVPPQEDPPVVETPSEQPQPEPMATPEMESQPPERPKPKPEDAEPAFSFVDVQDHEFYFSSGAGAWATILQINADGSFSGEYHDSDMGIGGEEYPNGTQYYCGFQGWFGQPVEIDAYTFSLPIESMNYENEVGSEEIRDGIRYIYSEPNGLANTDHILIYLPGAPLEELPMEYLSWVGYFDLTATTDTQLPFFGLYNEVEQAGFSGYERIVPPEELIDEPETYAEDTQAVLNYVDSLFANGRMALWCHLLPGTGPISASLDGYYGQVREVFARYNWTKVKETTPNIPYTAETWELWLVDNYTCKVDAWSNSNQVVFGFNAVDGSEKAVRYCYDGEPGSLSAALANLWGGPEFRYALVLLPVKGQDDQTLMEAYEMKFRELYLDSGAINGYELRELKLIPEGEVIGGSQNPFFLMNYSVKPSDLSAPCWKNYAVGEDGWVDISVEVNLSLTGYQNSETVWRCGFWQPPSERTTPPEESNEPSKEIASNIRERSVLEYVDALFESENVSMLYRSTTHNPKAVNMGGYYPEIRALFAQRTWTRQEADNSLDDRVVYLEAGNICIAVESKNWIHISEVTPEGTISAWYSAAEESEDLIWQTIYLWDGPHIIYHMVFVSPSVSGEQEIAESYARSLRSIYLGQGLNITEFEQIEVKEISEDAIYPSFCLTYKVKPTNPAAPAWKCCPAAENGWVTFCVNVEMTASQGMFRVASWMDVQ